jgi:hypothetical protein
MFSSHPLDLRILESWNFINMVGLAFVHFTVRLRCYPSQAWEETDCGVLEVSVGVGLTGACVTWLDPSELVHDVFVTCFMIPPPRSPHQPPAHDHRGLMSRPSLWS